MSNKKIVAIGFVYTGGREAMGVWFRLHKGDNRTEILKSWRGQRKMEFSTVFDTRAEINAMLRLSEGLKSQIAENVVRGIEALKRYIEANPELFKAIP